MRTIIVSVLPFGDKKIENIKSFRGASGFGLKEAKDAIDEIQEKGSVIIKEEKFYDYNGGIETAYRKLVQAGFQPQQQVGICTPTDQDLIVVAKAAIDRLEYKRAIQILEILVGE
jgi:hypothetical protein